MRTLSSLILGMGVVLMPLAAAAEELKSFPECTREPTEGDISAAKAAFQAGNASFNEADYPRAILYWEDAYRRDCTAHALLLNLARAYELGGQKRHAVIALETYLARKPDAADKDQIHRRIEVLNAQIQQEEAKAQTPEPAPGPPIAAPQALPPEPVAPPQDTPSSSSGAPIAPLIIAGAGAGVAVVGGILWLSATGDVNDYEKQCTDGRRGCDPDIVNDANSARDRQTAWGIVSLVGLGVAGGGLAWYFLAPRKNDTTAGVLAPGAHARITPLLGPAFTGMSVGGSF